MKISNLPHQLDKFVIDFKYVIIVIQVNLCSHIDIGLNFNTRKWKRIVYVCQKCLKIRPVPICVIFYMQIFRGIWWFLNLQYSQNCNIHKNLPGPAFAFFLFCRCIEFCALGEYFLLTIVGNSNLVPIKAWFVSNWIFFRFCFTCNSFLRINFWLGNLKKLCLDTRQ